MLKIFSRKFYFPTDSQVAVINIEASPSPPLFPQPVHIQQAVESNNWLVHIPFCL